MDFLSPLPAAGEDSSEFLPDSQLFLRHGSSLALISAVTRLLNGCKDFEEKDPSEDWSSWKERSQSFSLYFAALFDLDGAPVAVLRAVLDGVPIPNPPHNRRMLIDYTYVIPSMRNKGLATILCEFVANICSMMRANSYVLALEDSCLYWMSKGFILEENVFLQARLNIFPDTHLLRRATDPGDPGDEADLALQVDHASVDCDKRPRSVDGVDGSGSEEEEDGAALAKAIALSIRDR